MATLRAITRRAGALALVGAFAAGAHAAAQTDGVQADPIRCWWRTSVAAVRVGEPFSIVLTCAVVETESMAVVPNRSELAPNAIQLPPFDVIGGSEGSDLRTADHRFFQYDYQVRLIADNFFGQDVELPELKISYKVRSSVGGDAIEGRDQSYFLPVVTVRVMSLVPGDATDIRDASSETFADIDRRRTRASVLRAIGGVLMAFAGLAAVVAVVRLAGGPRRATRAAPRLASDGAILREAGRELAALGEARRRGVWTPTHGERLLTALRILSAYALGLPATPVPARTAGSRVPTAAGAQADVPGQLTVRSGWRGTEVTVGGWVTPAVIAQHLAQPSSRDARRAGALAQLQTILARLSAMQYSRDNRIDDGAIDEALRVGTEMLRRLRIENVWLAKKLRALRSVTPPEARPWSR